MSQEKEKPKQDQSTSGASGPYLRRNRLHGAIHAVYVLAKVCAVTLSIAHHSAGIDALISTPQVELIPSTVSSAAP